MPTSNELTILSLYIQGIKSSYDELYSIVNFLQNNNVEPSDICLQETKLAHRENIDTYNLSGYNNFSTRYSISIAGSLTIYVKDIFEVAILSSNHSKWLWERLFCKIRNIY